MDGERKGDMVTLALFLFGWGRKMVVVEVRKKKL